MKRLTRYVGPMVLTLFLASVAVADCPLIKTIYGAHFWEPILCIRTGAIGNLCIYSCSGAGHFDDEVVFDDGAEN